MHKRYGFKPVYLNHWTHKKQHELKTKKLKHTYFPMKTTTCLSPVMDVVVVDFIVNLYNARSVRICAKSVAILFLIIWHQYTPNKLKFTMSVQIWLLCNTASFLPQILAGKVLLKN